MFAIYVVSHFSIVCKLAKRNNYYVCIMCYLLECEASFYTVTSCCVFWLKAYALRTAGLK
uniref:Uncharacterized protein n=1 Tax=Anguilla anguilla TaxID=7936 RepID=A0A0E9S0Y0_ANGAN